MKRSRQALRNAHTQSGQQQQQVRQQRHALLDALDNLDDSNERLEACSALAAKFEPLDDDDFDTQTKLRKELGALSRDGLFKSLVRCANDDESLIRATAVGALRNLALVGQEKALAFMQQEDAWSAMCAILSRQIPLDEVELSARKEALYVMELMCEWSDAVAERRFSESLPIIAGTLSTTNNRDISEACTRLLFTVSDDNLTLARAMLSTDAGRSLGQKLEAIMGALGQASSEDALVGSANALGTLLHLGAVSEIAELPMLVERWLGLSLPILTDAALPRARLNENIIADALAYEEDAIDESGQSQRESDQLRRYLDLIQAQALVFDVWGDLLRKVAAEKEAESKKVEFWRQVVAPLEQGGLLACAVKFTIHGLPQDCPRSLALAVSSLQESSAQCASAAFEAFFNIEATFSREALKRCMEALCQALPSEKDRVVALAELVAATSRKSGSRTFETDDEVTALMRLVCESSIQEVRALLCGPVARVCEENAAALLPRLAPVLIERLQKDRSLIVATEVADVLMDAFSDDNRQMLFDSLHGLPAFVEYLKSFDRRLFEAKRSLQGGADDEAAERMLEVKANVEAFVEWRQKMGV